MKASLIEVVSLLNVIEHSIFLEWIVSEAKSILSNVEDRKLKEFRNHIDSNVGEHMDRKSMMDWNIESN